MSSEKITVGPQDIESLVKSFLTVEMVRNLDIPEFENPVPLDPEVETSFKVKHDSTKVGYLLAGGVSVPNNWYSEDEGGVLTANRDFHAELITMTVFRRRLEDIFFLLKHGVSDEDLANELLLDSQDIFEKRLDSNNRFRAPDVTGIFQSREARKKSLGLLVNPTGLVSLEELIMIRDIVLNSYKNR